MPERDEVEKALALLDSYNRQLEAYSQQLNLLHAVLEETTRARDALEGLRQEPAPEILVPLGANTFIHAQASERKNVLAGVGAGLTVEKPWTDAEQQLSQRATQVEAEIRRLSEAAMRLQTEANQLQAAVQEDLESFRDSTGA